METKKGKKTSFTILSILVLLIIGCIASFIFLNSKPSPVSDEYSNTPPDLTININDNEYIPLRTNYKWNTGKEIVTNDDPMGSVYKKVSNEEVKNLESNNINLRIIKHNDITNPKLTAKVWYNEDESKQLNVDSNDSITLPTTIDNPAVLEVELTAEEGIVQYLLPFNLK